jgi:hypothetical protein
MRIEISLKRTEFQYIEDSCIILTGSIYLRHKNNYVERCSLQIYIFKDLNLFTFGEFTTTWLPNITQAKKTDYYNYGQDFITKS